MSWIFKIAPVLLIVAVVAHEACAAVVPATPTALPSNKATLTDASGYRDRTSGGLNNVGSNGNYWSFAPNSQANARNLNFNSGNVNPLNNNNRANGFSVRPSRALGVAGCFSTSAMKYSATDIRRLVTEAYLKAREEERSSLAQLTFETNLEQEISKLSRELYRRTWYPQPLDWFVIKEPAVREVFAPKFRDRVVSHVLFLMISPIFERYFICDSFSCRTDKGTLVGIERLEHHIRSVTENWEKEAWSLNYDIRAYFMSINRARLYGIISETLSKNERRHPNAIDYGFADWLLRTTILERNPLDGCVYHGNPALISLIQPGKSLRDQAPGVGIPIGDVMNQLCSNIYLNTFDQWVKRELKIRHYVRYVDDGKMLHQDREYLEECRERADEFLRENLRLSLHPNKTVITNLRETVYFLGAAIKPYRRYARNDTVARFRRKMREMNSALETGELTALQVLPRLNSHLGYFSHFKARKITAGSIAAAPAIAGSFDFAKNLTKATIKK